MPYVETIFQIRRIFLPFKSTFETLDLFRLNIYDHNLYCVFDIGGVESNDVFDVIY